MGIIKPSFFYSTLGLLEGRFHSVIGIINIFSFVDAKFGCYIDVSPVPFNKVNLAEA